MGSVLDKLDDMHDDEQHKSAQFREKTTAIHKDNPVSHPNHYTYGKVELKDLILDLPFWQGNAIKYIYRSGMKGTEVEDLRKAIQYLEFHLEELEDA